MPIAIINVLKKVFIIVFFISLCMTAAQSAEKAVSKRKGKGTSKRDLTGKESWNSKCDALIKFSTLLLLLGTVLVLLIHFPQYSWMLVVFALPIYLADCVNAGIAAHTFYDVIKSNDKVSLSNDEIQSIHSISYVVFLLTMWTPFDLVWNYITTQSSPILSDACSILFITSILFVYSFLIFSLISTPICRIARIITTWKKKSSFMVYLKKISLYLTNHLLSQYQSRTFLGYTLNYWKNVTLSAKLLLVPLVPLVFIVDVAVRVVVSLFRWGCMIISLVAILLRQIASAINSLLVRISNLSDKNAVSLSFRAALIVSLACVVILNRYHPIFREYERTTAVFEFIASSIIIPVIFEWIYGLRNAK